MQNAGFLMTRLILPAVGLRCYFINSFILFILSIRLDEKPENMFYRIKDFIHRKSEVSSCGYNKFYLMDQLKELRQAIASAQSEREQFPVHTH